MKVQTLECQNLIVHRKEKTWKKILKLVLTFLLGLAIATTFHAVTQNRRVRKTAEKICEVFARDESECKNGIDSVFDIANNEVQNNIDVEE